MTLSEIRRKCRHSVWSSSLLALILVAAALGVRLAAGAALQSFPYMTFFPAVAVATYMGDRRGGWVATTASLVIVWFIFLEPAYSFEVANQAELISLAVFLMIAGIVVEVTAMLNRSSEAALRMADENRMLFMELKHRTANDLQMVASLLSLHQAAAADPASRAILGDAIGRLRLLGNLHRQMYEPGSMSLDMRRFLTQLCADLGASLARIPITCDIRADRVLDRNMIVPLTMIIHELVANALEHGACARSDGHVIVRFTAAPAGGHTLTVEDDGPGLPDGFDPKQSKRLGMKLVKAFTAQIGGALEWLPRPGGGTLVILSLPAIDAAKAAPDRLTPQKPDSARILERSRSEI
jgi:two-component sensor histidine kinase